MGLEDGLTPYQPTSSEELDFLEGTARERVRVYQRFEPGQYHSLPFQDQQSMERYLARLREEGLDLGRGDAEFGFRMPLPKKDASQRTLVIFRRHR